MSAEEFPSVIAARARLQADAERTARQHDDRIERREQRKEDKDAARRGDPFRVVCAGPGKFYWRGKTLAVEFPAIPAPANTLPFDVWVNGTLQVRNILVQ